MNPRIIKGIRNPRNSPNMELKVLNMRITGIGVKLPIRIPKMMAIIILGINPNFSLIFSPFLYI